MRIAYDWGPLLDRSTGVGRYAAELAAALEARGVELVRYAVALRGRGGAPEVRRWRAPARVVRSAWRRWDAPVLERLVGDVDVVHATNFVLPAVARTPGVVTVHDLSFLRDDVFPGGSRLRDLVPWSVRRARAVAVPTRAVASELCERVGVPEERVVVTPEGVSPRFFGATPLPGSVLAALGIDGPFAVAVGTIEPRKNLPRLLRAWRAAALDGWTLALAGPRGWGPDLPETPGVVVVGWVADETLPGLLAAAGMFCYPSLYEGFGLPPLEAMAAGTPALVGDHPAAREVVRDGALLVDPTDVEALAEGLRALARDDALRRTLVVAGRARASLYSWERCATATLQAYARAVA